MTSFSTVSDSGSGKRSTEGRRPALVIGAGGSGITTARMARAIAAEGQDGRLRTMIAQKELIFFGVDADQSENDPKEIDLRLLPLGERNGSLMRETMVPLPTLDDFVWLDPQGIVEAVNRIQQDALKRQDEIVASRHGASEFRFTHELIARWFPFQDSPDDPLLPVSQAKEGGAQQLRPLGRLGLFLNVEKVYSALKAHLTHIMARGRSTPGSVEVYIVSSLAGGTGSGIFWDLAFLVRRIAPQVEIRGLFFMPSVFGAAAAQTNAQPNAYAALAELANWKNWLHLDAQFRVEYPAAERIDFVADRGGRPSFDSIHLFGPSGNLVGTNDVALANVRSTAAAVAGTLLTYLRRDVRNALRHKAQNAANDTRAGNAEAMRACIFNTAASIEFPYINAAQFEAGVVDAARQLLERDLQADGSLPLYTTDAFLRDLASQFAGHRGPRAVAIADNAAQIRKLADEWKSRLGDASGSGLLQLVLDTVIDRNSEYYLPHRARAIADALGAEHQRNRDPKDRVPWIRAGGLFEDARQRIIEHVDRALGGHTAGAGTHLSSRFDFRGFLRKIDRLADGINDDRAFRDSFVKACGDEIGWPLALVMDEVTAALGILTSTLETVVEQRLPTHLLSPDLRALLADVRQRIEEAARKAMTARDADGLSPSEDRAAVKAFVRIAAAIDPEREDIRKTVGFLRHFAIRSMALMEIRSEYGEVFGEFATLIRNAYALPRDLADRFVTQGLGARGEPARHLLRKVLDADDQARQDIRRLADEARARRLKALDGAGSLRDADDADRLKPFARLLRSIRDTLARSWDERNYLDQTVNKLQEGLAAILKDRAGATSAVGQNGDLRSGLRDHVPQWRDALNILREWQDGKDPTARATLQDMVRALLDVRPESTFDILVAYRQNQTRPLERFQLEAGQVMAAFARHWVGDDNLLQSRIGGSDGLRNDLMQLRPAVFAGGADENSIATDNLVVILPTPLQADGSDEKDGGIKLREYLRTMTQSALNATAICPGNSDHPVVYYEQLYRSTSEISNIEEMYRSYMSWDPKKRSFFHISRQCVGDLLHPLHRRGSNQPVYCGNVDCQRDIRHLDRAVLTCPGCQKPIWNRCGNPRCQADDVMTLIDLRRKDRPAEEKITKCPACGDALETYFWACSDPAHAMYLIESDKEVCPHCVAEANSGRRGASDIRKRPGLASLRCPGCPDWAAGETVVPADLKDYYTKGVNGFKHLDFARKIKRYGRDAHFCPSPQPQRHITFPTCPEGRFDAIAQHHLYQMPNGHFQCPKHHDKIFYQCNGCGYPVEVVHDPAETSTPRLVEPKCPRCLKALRICAMCSYRDRRAFVAGDVKAGDPERCPRCAYPMNGLQGCKAEHANQGLQEAGFCRNTFACSAGRHPWRYQTELSYGECEACIGTKAPLLPADRLREHIEGCPVCLILHGLPQHRTLGIGGAEGGYDIESFDAAKVLKFMMTMVRVNGGAKHLFEVVSLGLSCPLCGVRRGEILKIFLQHVKEKQPGIGTVCLVTRPYACGEVVGDGTSSEGPAAATLEELLGPMVSALLPKGRDDLLVAAPETERLIDAIREFHQHSDARQVRRNLKSGGFLAMKDFQTLCIAMRRLFDNRVFGGRRLIERLDEVEETFRAREPDSVRNLSF